MYIGILSKTMLYDSVSAQPTSLSLLGVAADPINISCHYATILLEVHMVYFVSFGGYYACCSLPEDHRRWGIAVFESSGPDEDVGPDVSRDPHLLV